MADQYYDSDLTGQQLDAAFAKMANIDTYVSQAASSASEANGYAETATSAAGQAQTYASQANTAKNNAQTYAGQASDSADSAQTYAGQASGSASAAAASAASIEGDVEAAANSASQAATSAGQAAESASDAADAAQTAEDAKSTVQQSASAAANSASQAAQSAQDAQSAATQASGSASTAQSAATLIEDNLEAIQAAPTNAQAAQTSAQAAEASAAAAEAAADRAEQIADFDPADFATAAQGALAESAVQSVNGKSGTAVTLTPADIGAATAAQGAKADSAVQSVNGQEPDSQGDVQITIPPAGVTSVNGKTGAVTLSAADVDAAQELLTGDITNVTPAQVREALQAGRQVILTVNSGNDILAAWVDTGTNVQCLYGWNVGAYANRPRAISTDAYSGNPTGSNTWSYEKLYGNVLPEVTSADNGKTVVVQNGQWNLGTAGGGGKFDFIANTGLTSWSEGNQYSSSALYAGGYDAVGIEFYPNYMTDTDVFSPMQVFPIPENGQSRKYGVVCMDVNSSPMGEAQTRIIEIQNNGSSVVKITSVTGGYYYNWGNRGADDRCAVPARIYGIKF